MVPGIQGVQQAALDSVAASEGAMDSTRAAAQQVMAITIDSTSIQGDLAVPARPAGVVLFAHGSGSSRFSRRNRAVARALQDSGFATLLIDLLTREEDELDLETAQFRFDIALLARRLELAIAWLAGNPLTRPLPLGLFGASTGAAAALVTAAHAPQTVRAVVSRGGRPDLAGDALLRVQSPTLLIVGGNDPAVIGLNRQAFALLPGVKQLEIVPGATHLFEEPGALEQVARLAVEWFRGHLVP